MFQKIWKIDALITISIEIHLALQQPGHHDLHEQRDRNRHESRPTPFAARVDGPERTGDRDRRTDGRARAVPSVDRLQCPPVFGNDVRRMPHIAPRPQHQTSIATSVPSPAGATVNPWFACGALVAGLRVYRARFRNKLDATAVRISGECCRAGCTCPRYCRYSSMNRGRSVEQRDDAERDL